MNCPVCDVPLSISSREGVEIDFCPQCRGVWLDRGELDKVIERAATSLAPAAPVGGRESGYNDERREPRYDERREPRYDERRESRYDDHDRYDDDYRSRERNHKKRKRRSFLEDLFEFE
jgi:Zn-finger nucleic acid-binding protein